MKNDCILYFVTFSNKTDTVLLLRDKSVSSEVQWLVLKHYCFLSFILHLKKKCLSAWMVLLLNLMYNYSPVFFINIEV